MSEVHHGCGIDGLMSLDPGSVDLVLSDLPSGETAAPFDKKADLSALFPAIWQALKPNGIAVLMASSFRFAAEVREASLGEFRYDLIWEKSLATGFLNADKRPLRSHEFVLVLWRELGVFNPQMWRGVGPITSNRKRNGGDYRSSNGSNYGTNGKAKKSRAGEWDRYPLSVVRFRNVDNTERVHPQQKPESLLAYLVRQYSNPGDLVADPYSGSGTTGRAALNEGRRFIGWDTSADFVQAANERLKQRGLFEVAT